MNLEEKIDLLEQQIHEMSQNIENYLEEIEELEKENEQLSARNRELARALEYIVNDVTEETIAGGIRVLKKIKGVE